jgi:hypothetical protein
MISGLLMFGCSNGSSPKGTSAGVGAGGARPLTGTWDVATTSMGSTGATTTTVTVGQDSLTITSPDFSLTATRTGNTLAFTDKQSPGAPSNDVTLTATQTTATFDAGIVPFDLGGSWTMDIAPAGRSKVMTCTLMVSATEIDGACQKVTSDGFDFSFTSKKTSSAASAFGDFGGMWTNVWTDPSAPSASSSCTLSFMGNSINTCSGEAAMNGASPLSGITFTYDGVNTVSGAAQGWAEYSATRR